ncbi:MAG: ferredoxin family protein [Desulfobacterota bacterium]|nr:ferredoxin family protein [Thermodesulfobacteriota bacterium]MDW8001912.1 ferredoxin family protein [Deltaproteobacteria bacterium]
MPPVIEPELCSACGKCVDVCSEDVYFGSEKDSVPHVAYPEFCFHCRLCVEECPNGAIKLRIPLPLMLSYKRGGNHV